jgi:hypothetical protein
MFRAYEEFMAYITALANIRMILAWYIGWEFEGSDRGVISCQWPRVAGENSYKYMSESVYLIQIYHSVPPKF